VTRKELTDSDLKGLKAPEEGRVVLTDTRVPGLQFRLSNAGASWSFRFHDPNAKKLVRATIGPYPSIKLSEARRKAEAMRGEVREGINPVERRRAAIREATTNTFEALAARYLKEYATRKKRASSVEADKRNLRLHILPKWGRRPYSSIRRGDVIEVVEALISCGKHTLANRVQALISKIFSFAIDCELVELNPCNRMDKRGVERVKDRVLNDQEIRLFWSRILESPASPQSGLPMRLILTTACRPGEAAGLRRDELCDFDDPLEATWVLPGATRTKNKRTHIIPLTEQAQAVIREGLTLYPEGTFIFGGETPIDAHALSVAMDRFSKELTGNEPGIETWKANKPTPHDLRRTVETRLSSMGVPKEDRDAVLNHVRNDVGSKHYDKYDRLLEKRTALNKWGEALARILDPR
jgi:integrase